MRMLAVSVFLVLASGAPRVSLAVASAAEVTQARPAAARLTLRQLVTPASRVELQGRPVRFALHAHIRFETLDDGDSADIPIPIYVGYLKRIREMAQEMQL